MSWRRPGFLTTSLDVCVTSNAIGNLEEVERRRRTEKRRLVLVLDIDHTLVNCFHREMCKAKCVEQESLVVPLANVGGGDYVLKARPHVQEFLEQAHELSDMYLYTHGSNSYALAVVANLDPNHTYFGDPPRLFTRDNTPLGVKSLNEIFPVDTSLVLVVDDRDEVWPADVRDAQLVRVAPYLFFPKDTRNSISLEGFVAACQPSCDARSEFTDKAPGDTNSEVVLRPHKRQRSYEMQVPRAEVDCCQNKHAEETDRDVQLLFLLRTIRCIHCAIFGSSNSSSENTAVRMFAHVGEVVPRLRGGILKACHICFTGFAHAPVHLRRQPLAWWCVQMGATIQETLDEKSTHLVAVRCDTCKYHDALRRRAHGQEVHIVHPGWVLKAMATWHHPNSDLFTVPSTGLWPKFLEIWRSDDEVPPPVDLNAFCGYEACNSIADNGGSGNSNIPAHQSTAQEDELDIEDLLLQDLAS